jgi:predicted site-specific integrase-resolvase
VNLEDEKSFQEELTEDLITIIHHFSMKFYGKRKNKCKSLEENAISLNEDEDK